MRKYISTMLFHIMILASSSVLAQQEQKGNGEYFDYEIKQSLRIKHFRYDSQSVDSTPANDKTVYDGIIFHVVYDMKHDTTYGDYYVIRFYKIKPDSSSDFQSDSTIINSTNTLQNEFNYWCLPASYLKDEERVIKRYSTWWKSSRLVAGQLTIPFKVRPRIGAAPADFTGDFTIGATGGWGMRLSHYKQNHINLTVGGGLTSIGADSLTTGGYLSESQRWSALTGALAITVDFNGFQIGGVTGCDFVGGTPGNKWIYNMKPWFSIGIGYQFIKPKE